MRITVEVLLDRVVENQIRRGGEPTAALAVEAGEVRGIRYGDGILLPIGKVVGLAKQMAMAEGGTPTDVVRWIVERGQIVAVDVECEG